MARTKMASVPIASRRRAIRERGNRISGSRAGDTVCTAKALTCSAALRVFRRRR
jgi:hypothetical protein